MTQTHESALLHKIAAREAAVAVVGLGYVGLPLAVEFALAGFHVWGIDVDAARVAGVSRGESYIGDVPSETLGTVVARGLLRASTDAAVTAHCDAAIICVPTPLRKTKDPDVSFIVDAVSRVRAHAHAGQLIVLESTTYPGTCEELVAPMLAETGLEVGGDLFLAFSPERVDPGNKKFTTRNIPKVVGGINEASTRVAAALYGAVIERIHPVSSTKTAEMVKLLENTFRSVNIGLINELAIICDRMGVDVWEVIEAAATKPFGFMPFYPGPGLGGHCLPIDPIYLSWKAKLLDVEANFIDLAARVNAAMPRHVVEKITAALNDEAKPVRGSRILVLGVAYKRDVADIRESPALDILKHLIALGAHVAYSDPHVPRLQYGGLDLASVELTPEILAAQHCVVIVANHTAFDYRAVVAHAPLVLDTRNAARGCVGRARVVKL
ncbi:MAG TPA: nucleotide sugar dehydrogenase [Planctomycetota bacterium]|nr:nucleotide sugar dehydrogenase [Planctomycetota bacterium]HRR78810.1 nucleotide sugar dehydrogenase [Planctomycetota bacterium]HRT92883.1 nucleotide sugar dehydrogenase [Planctomycetota bacterium]